MGAILSWIIVSLIQGERFPARSRNLTYTVAVVLLWDKLQPDLVVAYASQTPPEAQPRVLVTYISDW